MCFHTHTHTLSLSLNVWSCTNHLIIKLSVWRPEVTNRNSGKLIFQMKAIISMLWSSKFFFSESTTIYEVDRIYLKTYSGHYFLALIVFHFCCFNLISIGHADARSSHISLSSAAFILRSVVSQRQRSRKPYRSGIIIPYYYYIWIKVSRYPCSNNKFNGSPCFSSQNAMCSVPNQVCCSWTPNPRGSWLSTNV